MHATSILPYGGHTPRIHASAFAAPTTTLIGQVDIGPGSSIWYGTIARGDNDAIAIGRNSNVQDGCILHVDPGWPLHLGDDVSLGHGAVVHGSEVADHVLIGMRATVLNGCTIGRYALIAAGAVVRENTVVPERTLIAGVPGRVVREVSDDECTHIDYISQHYVAKARTHREAWASALREQVNG